MKLTFLTFLTFLISKSLAAANDLLIWYWHTGGRIDVGEVSI